MRRGFTIVECMIVIAIIGILAALAIPNFLKARERQSGKRMLHSMHDTDPVVEKEDKFILVDAPYVLVVQYNTDDFIASVNAYLAKGYKLYGNPYSHVNVHCQTLVKP